MIFLTGATGYMGRRLAAELERRGRQVTALVRKDSEKKAPPGAAVIVPRTAIPEGAFAVLEDPTGARIGVFQKAS